MGAAFEIVLAAADPRQPIQHGADMRRLAAVAGAGQRDFPVPEIERLRRPGLDKGQRLDRLDRRARIDGRFDVAGGHHHLALGIDHGDGCQVPAFDHGASGDLDDRRAGGLSAGGVPQAPCKLAVGAMAFVLGHRRDSGPSG